MANNFEDYLKQLQSLENSETIATLKAIRDMNLAVLSFFPEILVGIEKLIESGTAPHDVIEDIKRVLPVLSRCRSSYEELTECERSKFYASQILRILNKKESISIQEIAQYEEDLSKILNDNARELRKEKDSSEAEKAEALRRSSLEAAERKSQEDAAQQVTNEVLSILRQGNKNKLNAVKFYKEKTGTDLKSAKEYIDNLCREYHLDVNSNSGCYIATAVYGSYDCPEVWTLRRYRDNVLDHSWYGRLFIRCYYAISPSLVKWFGKTSWFRNLFKNILNKWVSKLNEKGVENSTYIDNTKRY